MKDIHDVIKHAKFGDDRLRGSGVVAGQISAFPIDSAGRTYNTLTLPCERVIVCVFCSIVRTLSTILSRFIYAVLDIRTRVVSNTLPQTWGPIYNISYDNLTIVLR